MRELERSVDHVLGLWIGPGENMWLNPAEKALRLLKENCTFIYGNHDNYLINLGPTKAAGIPPRKRYWESEGIFIEHGHRLEATLVASGDPGIPTNYDGSTSGYETTIEYYEECKTMIAHGEQPGLLQKKKLGAADWFAQKFQQTQYWGEFAQVWIGRQSLKLAGLKPPHVFVIGHTHMPMLAYINIEFGKPFG
jgi:predicted phosphodiesterase